MTPAEEREEEKARLKEAVLALYKLDGFPGASLALADVEKLLSDLHYGRLTENE